MADSEIVKKIKGEFKKTPNKKRKQPLSVTESVGNKQFVLENITSSKQKSSSKKKQSGGQNFCKVPNFGGLSMILSPEDSNTDTEASSQSSKKQKDSSKLTETLVPSNSKKQKMSKPSKQKKIPKEETSDSQAVLDLVQEINNLKSKLRFDSQSDSDSASSADTDEILQKHKAHQTQAFDLTPSPESSGKSYLKMLSKQRCSVLDNKLLTLAGIDSEKTNNTDNASTKACYDSDDSELDSNDFELVAKRLAQRVSDKKASKSKSRITKSTPETIPMSTHADAFEEVLQALQPSATESESKLVPSKKATAEEKNKSLTVNEKRLQAVKEKMKIKQQQQDIMKKALDNVDNKRKVFNSDDDDDDDDKITAETNKKAKITQQTDKEFFMQSDGEADATGSFEPELHFGPQSSSPASPACDPQSTQCEPRVQGQKRKFSDDEPRPMVRGPYRRKDKREAKASRSSECGFEQQQQQQQQQQQRPANTDKHDTFGQHVANAIREMSAEQQIFTEKIISDVLFEGRLGNLSRAAHLDLPSAAPPYIH